MSNPQIPLDVLSATDEYVVAEKLASAVMFRRRLKEIDSRLDLIFVHERSIVFPDSPRYYIIRRNDVGPTAYWVIQTPDGEYCEPGEEHIQALQRKDAASRNLADELRRAHEKAELEKQKAKVARSEQFREALNERLSHVLDTRIAVPRDA